MRLFQKLSCCHNGIIKHTATTLDESCVLVSADEIVTANIWSKAIMQWTDITIFFLTVHCLVVSFRDFHKSVLPKSLPYKTLE